MSGEREHIVVTLKLWQIIALMVFNLVTFAGGVGYVYGSLAQRLTESERRIGVLENANPITRTEFEDFRGEVNDKLNQIDQHLLDKTVGEH